MQMPGFGIQVDLWLKRTRRIPDSYFDKMFAGYAAEQEYLENDFG